jgi:hypothetical protein
LKVFVLQHDLTCSGKKEKAKKKEKSGANQKSKIMKLCNNKNVSVICYTGG